MNVDWEEIATSSRCTAIAYDPESERIFVRFRDGSEWQYHGCPPAVWAEFSDPATSKGVYINENLNHHQNGPLVS